MAVMWPGMVVACMAVMRQVGYGCRLIEKEKPMAVMWQVGYGCRLIEKENQYSRSGQSCIDRY
jgi:hypothetical protein